jgi:hypothetical protein
VVAHYADVTVALRDGYKPFHPTGRMGEEGVRAVGVMYTAPQDSTTGQLNPVAPLSFATWHRHVDFCGGPRNLPLDQQFGPYAQFGPQGSIHTEEACQKAGGVWIAPNQVWAGMDMQMDANTDDKEMKK